MNNILIVVVVVSVLVLLVWFMYPKVVGHPIRMVVPPGTTEEEIKDIIYIEDLPRNTVLKEYTLVWDTQDKRHPARLPPGTIVTKTGAIIPPGHHGVYMGDVEEISLGLDEPSRKECLRLQHDGYTIIKPKREGEEWVARRPALAQYRHYGSPNS